MIHRAVVAAVAALVCGLAPGAVAAETASLADLDATRARPLFSPTRRPPPRHDIPSGQAAATEAQDVQTPAPNLELSGVIVGHDRRVAIVKHPQDARTTDLSIGDTIDGWIVQTIEPRGIVLRRDFRSVALDMHDPAH